MNMLGLPSVKKWTDFLTFNGKSRQATPRSAQDVVSPPPPPMLPVESKDGPTEEETRKDPPTTSRPDVDQQSLDEAMSTHQVSASQSVTQNAPSDDKISGSPAEASQGSLLSPALEYLTSAAGGFFGVHHPKSAPSGESSRMEEISQEGQGDNTGVSQEAEPPKSVVDVIEVGTDENGEDARTETSDKSSEQHNVAGKSQQRILSSSEPAPGEPLAHESPSAESAHENVSKPLEEEKEFILSRVSSRRSSTSSSKPAVAQPPPEAFFVPLSAYLEDEETKELRLRRVYHISVRECNDIVSGFNPFFSWQG
jgi:hypothetical protein